MDPKSAAHLILTPTRVINASQAAFEAFVKRTDHRPGCLLEMSPNGTYKDKRVAAKWSAWQAAIKWKESQ